MAYDRIADKGIVIARLWRDGWLTVPGISVVLLPKLACPLCWLAVLFPDHLVCWPWIPDLYEVPSVANNCTADPRTWNVGIQCETTPKVRAVRVGPCRCGGSPDRQVQFGIAPVTFTGIVAVVVTSAWNM